MRRLLTHRSGIAVLFALAIFAANSAANPAPLVYAGQFGSYGAANGQFNTPYGVDVSVAQHVYVTDFINNNVQEFTLTGDFVRKWGVGGTGPGQLNAPYGVVSDRGYVYVVENQNHRVSKFTVTGVFVTSWGGYQPGSADGQFRDPSAVVADTTGNLYVADTDNNRIQKFSPAGALLAKWGSFGTADGQFRAPAGIVADHAGFVYVVDTGNNRVQKFAADGSFLLSWGGYGTGPGKFSQPNGGAEDLWGNIYVVDTGNNRVQKFTSGGAYLGEFGSYGGGNGQLLSPFSAAGTQNGDVFVADSYNSRVEWFTANTPADAGTALPGPALRLGASPRPARSDVTLRFSLPRSESPRLAVFDARGRELWRAQPGALTAGEHTARWDLRGPDGARVAPGVYFARLDARGGSRTTKLVVIE